MRSNRKVMKSITVIIIKSSKFLTSAYPTVKMVLGRTKAVEWLNMPLYTCITYTQHSSLEIRLFKDQASG